MPEPAPQSLQYLNLKRMSIQYEVSQVEHRTLIEKTTQYQYTSPTVSKQPLQPHQQSIWYRGQTAFIQWNTRDIRAYKVRIELRRKGAVASTVVAADAINNGFFQYKRVPWGLISGNDYYIYIGSEATSEPSDDSIKPLVSDLFEIRNSEQTRETKLLKATRIAGRNHTQCA